MPEIILDGETIKKEWKDILKEWTDASVAARDREVNSLMGLYFKPEGYTGMKAWVRMAHCLYTPRHHEVYNKHKAHGDSERKVYPWLFGMLQTVLGVESQDNVRIRCHPKGEHLVPFAPFANAILDDELQEDRLDFDSHLSQVTFRALHYGTQHVFQDIDCSLTLCDPMSLLWDADAHSFEESRYFIYRRLIPRAVAKRKYGLNEMPEAIDWTKLDSENRFDSHAATGDGTVQQPTGAGEGRMCVETHLWFRDETQETTHAREMIERYAKGRGKSLEEGGLTFIAEKLGFNSPMSIQTPTGVQELTPEQSAERQLQELEHQPVSASKYPYGRILRFLNDERMVWDSDKLPPEDGRYPYSHHEPFVSKLDAYPVPGYYWAMPEWLAQGNMQEIIDEAATAQVRRARNRYDKLIVDPTIFDTADDKDAFENTDPRDTVYSQKFFEAGRETIKELHFGQSGGSGYERMLPEALTIGDKIAGTPDALRGIANSNTTSGEQAKTNAANANTRHKIFGAQITRYAVNSGRRILLAAATFRPDSDIIHILENVAPEDPRTGKPMLTFTIGAFRKMLKMEIPFGLKLAAQSGLPTDRMDKFEFLGKVIPQLVQLIQVDPDAAKIWVDASDIPELHEYFDRKIQKAMEQRQAMGDVPPGVQAAIYGQQPTNREWR